MLIKIVATIGIILGMAMALFIFGVIRTIESTNGNLITATRTVFSNFPAMRHRNYTKGKRYYGVLRWDLGF
jgi:hypothetical protein